MRGDNEGQRDLIVKQVIVQYKVYCIYIEQGL